MTDTCISPRCRVGEDGELEPRQTPGQAYLCSPCWSKLARDLGILPTLHAELAGRLAPQGSAPLSEHVGGTKDPGIALNHAAVVARDRIAGALASWSRIVVEERGLNPPVTAEPAVTAPFLARHVEWLVHQPYADEPADEIAELAGKARSLAYPNRERVYVGPCDWCQTDVSARPGATWGRCAICGTEYDVTDRQLWMRDQLENHLGGASYVSKVATGLGVRITASTIRTWVERKKLEPCHYEKPLTPDGKPRPVFRVGDVIRVASGHCQYETVESEREKPRQAS